MFSYSGDLTDSKNFVRFTIGDTNKDDVLLSDEEIQSLLVIHKTKEAAAVEACLAIAAKLARLADEKVGDVSVSFSQRAQAYERLAVKLRARFATDLDIHAGGISESDKTIVESDTDRKPPIFKIGLHDNLEKQT